MSAGAPPHPSTVHRRHLLPDLGTTPSPDERPPDAVGAPAHQSGWTLRLWDSDPSMPPAVLTDGWFMAVRTRRFLVKHHSVECRPGTPDAAVPSPRRRCGTRGNRTASSRSPRRLSAPASARFRDVRPRWAEEGPAGIRVRCVRRRRTGLFLPMRAGAQQRTSGRRQRGDHDQHRDRHTSPHEHSDAATTLRVPADGRANANQGSEDHVDASGASPADPSAGT